MDFQDPGIITTALTAGGAVVWAGVVQLIIQVLKGVPQIAGLLVGREKLTAFILGGVIVLLAFIAALGVVPPQTETSIVGIVGAVFAWFNISRLAMSFYDDFVKRETQSAPIPHEGARPTESVLSAKGWTG
jgi:hypothetical protein